MANKLKDLTGSRFGRLVAIKQSHSIRDNNRTKTFWECLCDCGKLTVTNKNNLISGDTTSCGCYALEVRKSMHTKHGMTGTHIYISWSAMKSRCLDEKDTAYDNYGGRGIKVCDRWINSFEYFYEDVQHLYTEGYTIERIDNDGNYELPNIAFIPLALQAKNRRSSIFVTIGSETKIVFDWCKELDINHKTVYNRIRNGWDAEKAIVELAKQRLDKQ